MEKPYILNGRIILPDGTRRKATKEAIDEVCEQAKVGSLLSIRTDNKSRRLVSFMDLPKKARADFDYIKPEDQWNDRFVRYKKDYLDVYDMMRVRTATSSPFPPEWDAYLNETFFSGVLVRYNDDQETVVCGDYYS